MVDDRTMLLAAVLVFAAAALVINVPSAIDGTVTMPLIAFIDALGVLARVIIGGGAKILYTGAEVSVEAIRW